MDFSGIESLSDSEVLMIYQDNVIESGTHLISYCRCRDNYVNACVATEAYVSCPCENNRIARGNSGGFHPCTDICSSHSGVSRSDNRIADCWANVWGQWYCPSEGTYCVPSRQGGYK